MRTALNKQPYDPWNLESILPTQLPGRTCRMDPHRSLRIAIMDSAIHDLRFAHRRTLPPAICYGCNVIAWMHGMVAPIPFEDCCDAIGLDPDGVRRYLRPLTSVHPAFTLRTS